MEPKFWFHVKFWFHGASIQADLLVTELSNAHMLVHRIGADISDTCSENYATMQAIQQQDIAYLSTYEIMSSRAVAQPPAGRFTPILGDNDLAYGSR